MGAKSSSDGEKFKESLPHHLRPAWFAHENVNRFPGAFLENPLVEHGYGVQRTAISPQRFGKPMNRQGYVSFPKFLFFHRMFVTAFIWSLKCRFVGMRHANPGPEHIASSLTSPSTIGEAHHCERFSKPCSHINGCNLMQTTCFSWMLSNWCHCLTSYVFDFERNFRKWETVFSKLGNLAFGTLT